MNAPQWSFGMELFFKNRTNKFQKEHKTIFQHRYLHAFCNGSESNCYHCKLKSDSLPLRHLCKDKMDHIATLNTVVLVKVLVYCQLGIVKEYRVYSHFNEIIILCRPTHFFIKIFYKTINIYEKFFTKKNFVVKIYKKTRFVIKT